MAAVRPPLDSATGERPMSIVVDRYELGPIGTNCYVVRASRSAEEAVVVDPSGDAAQLRLELAGVGARCSAILITHGHWDHLLGVAELAGHPFLADLRVSSRPSRRREAPTTSSPPNSRSGAW